MVELYRFIRDAIASMPIDYRVNEKDSTIKISRNNEEVATIEFWLDKPIFRYRILMPPIGVGSSINVDEQGEEEVEKMIKGAFDFVRGRLENPVTSKRTYGDVINEQKRFLSNSIFGIGLPETNLFK